MKVIKGTIIIFVALSVLLFAIYLFINCLIRIEDATFIVLEDKRSGVMRVLQPGYSFVWQGAIPGRISLSSFDRKNMNFFDLKIKITPLEELEGDSYSIKTQINIIYEIEDINLFIYRAGLRDGDKVYYKSLVKFLEGNLKKELSSYLSPYYKRSSILRDEKRIMERVISRVKSQCRSIGINILSYEIIGGLDLPTQDEFYKNLRYCNELRELEKNNKKELIMLRSKSQRENNLNKKYYENLSEISKLIKENPDLLKYIYIERMADNVKVIMTSDKSGMPLGLNFNEGHIESDERGEIDNLR